MSDEVKITVDPNYKNNSINFEEDQREDLDGANDANKLSDQVVKLQELEAELLVKEQEYKEMKRKV